MKSGSLISISDLTAKDAQATLSLAAQLKKSSRGDYADAMHRRVAALVFEKPSLRTRVTFETAMARMGGSAIYLRPEDIQLGQRETVEDAARNLGRWVDVIVARTFSHDTVEKLRECAGIPVINALSDYEHPCQALADFQTIQERFGLLKGLKLAWIGDGNNVLHSLVLLGALTGVEVVAACPMGYEPLSEVLALAFENRGNVTIVARPEDAVAGAHVVATDVWTSMGQETESATRKQVFANYQVNGALMKKAHKDAIFLHCLPAHRGEEVTAEVIDGPQSAVFDEAENRLWAQMAVLQRLVG